MICKKCGEDNADGAKFCNSCGSPLEETDIQNEGDGKAYEDSTAYNTQLRSGNNLPLLLSLMGLLIIAVIVLVVIILGSGDIEGKWYNPSLNQIMEFRANNEVILHTASGSVMGTYTYDDRNADGTITVGGINNHFVVNNDKITIAGNGGTGQTYIKMDDNLDVESIVNLQDNPTETNTNAQNTPTQEAPTTIEATPTIEITAEPTPTQAPTDTAFVPTPPPETPTPTPTTAITPTPTWVIMTPTPWVLITIYPYPIFTFSPISDIVGTWESQFTTDDSVYTFFDDYEYTYHPGGIAILTTGTYTYDNTTNTGVMTADGSYITTSFEYDEATDMIYVNGINPYVRQP